MPVTIPSPALTPGLVSIDAVRRALFGGDGSAASDHDALLQEWIDAESERFEGAIGQPVRSESITRILRGTGRATMLLRYWPVTAVSTLEYKANVSDWETIDADTYGLTGDGRTYRLEMTTGFTHNLDYRVTMTVGYATVPKDIADIVRDAVIMRWLDNPGADFGGRRMGLASESRSGEGFANATTSYDRSDFAGRWNGMVGKYQRGTGF